MEKVELKMPINMNKRLFVGNLSYQIKNFELKEFFEQFGKVVDVVIMESSLGRSKGFGYVEFDTEEAANKAWREGNNLMFMGRNIRVDIATERREREMKQRERSRERVEGRDKRYDRPESDFSYGDDRRLRNLHEGRGFEENRDYRDHRDEGVRDGFERRWDSLRERDSDRRYSGDRKYDNYLGGFNGEINRQRESDDRIYEPLERDRYKFETTRKPYEYPAPMDRFNEGIKISEQRNNVWRKGYENEREITHNGDDSHAREFEDLSETVVFIRNLPFTVDSFDLKKLFEPYHPIDANVAVERETKRSKGFGFVVFDNNKNQMEAIQGINNTTVEGRKVMVFKASKAQEEKTKIMK